MGVPTPMEFSIMDEHDDDNDDDDDDHGDHDSEKNGAAQKSYGGPLPHTWGKAINS